MTRKKVKLLYAFAMLVFDLWYFNKTFKELNEGN